MGRLPQRLHTTVENIGLYWHFVDIVWIIIFTAIYLIPAAAAASGRGAPTRSSQWQTTSTRREHAHPGVGQYVEIGIILAVMTLLEVIIYESFDSGLPTAIGIPALIVLTILKFALVVMWFMHLRFDHQHVPALLLRRARRWRRSSTASSPRTGSWVRSSGSAAHDRPMPTLLRWQPHPDAWLLIVVLLGGYLYALSAWGPTEAPGSRRRDAAGSGCASTPASPRSGWPPTGRSSVLAEQPVQRPHGAAPGLLADQRAPAAARHARLAVARACCAAPGRTPLWRVRHAAAGRAGGVQRAGSSSITGRRSSTSASPTTASTCWRTPAGWSRR